MSRQSEESEELAEDLVECPQCGGEGQALGALGKTVHFRCRACGWTFSATIVRVDLAKAAYLRRLEVGFTKDEALRNTRQEFDLSEFEEDQMLCEAAP